MLLVGLFGIFFPLNNGVGIILSMLLSFWCAYGASNFVEMELNVDDRKALIMYPLYLYYVSFAMITIFWYLYIETLKNISQFVFIYILKIFIWKQHFWISYMLWTEL